MIEIPICRCIICLFTKQVSHSLNLSGYLIKIEMFSWCFQIN
jgi:hypothetical protein